MKHLVITGNGGAALNALRAIRSVSRSHHITLISGEDCPAYSPVLTTHYLCGTISYRKMFICNRDFYRSHGVKTILGDGAVAVEPDRQRVVLAGGQAVPYDELLVATGSSVTVPPIPGAGECLTLWSAADARRIKGVSQNASTVAVVGAGLIGLQIVDALWRRKKKMIVIEMQDRVLPRVMDAAGAAIMQERLEGAGVQLRLGQQVWEVAQRGGGKGLRLSSGETVEADVVVFATGVRPNTGLLEGSGVALSPGVTVDEGGRTSAEHIYAAGDVAQGTHPITGRTQVNATWTNAVEGGWVAGLNMAGGSGFSRWRPARVNILSPLGLPVASLGEVDSPESGYDELVRRNGSTYRKLVFHRHRLVGAVLVGEVEAAGILSHLMDRETLSPVVEARLRQRSPFHAANGPWEPLQQEVV
ncbi:MAG: FAD-dependent oxidoreductase [Dehalococcoidia bacterium]|nr:FAD-dependent oxidoreductase [Dehalococcoidia bacterium]